MAIENEKEEEVKIDLEIKDDHFNPVYDNMDELIEESDFPVSASEDSDDENFIEHVE